MRGWGPAAAAASAGAAAALGAGLQLQGPELHALRHAGRHVLAPLYGVVSAQLEYVDVIDIVDMVDISSV